MGAIKATRQWAGGKPTAPGKRMPLWRRQMLRIFREARASAKPLALPPSVLNHFRRRPRATKAVWAEIRMAATAGRTTSEQVIERAVRWVLFAERMRDDPDFRPPGGG
jgi:hypothetical protein